MPRHVVHIGMIVMVDPWYNFGGKMLGFRTSWWEIWTCVHAFCRRRGECIAANYALRDRANLYSLFTSSWPIEPRAAIRWIRSDFALTARRARFEKAGKGEAGDHFKDFSLIERDVFCPCRRLSGNHCWNWKINFARCDWYLKITVWKCITTWQADKQVRNRLV